MLRAMTASYGVAPVMGFCTSLSTARSDGWDKPDAPQTIKNATRLAIPYSSAV